MAELGEFVRGPATAPQRVLTCHSYDERDGLRRERRSSDAPRLPGPEASEAAAVPPDHGRRLHDRERVGPSRPDARDDDPEGAVDRAKRRPPRRSTASCCRSTRISRTRLARGRKAATIAPSRAETIANTTGDVHPDRSARHRRIAAADRVESMAPRCLFSHHRARADAGPGRRLPSCSRSWRKG